MLSSEDAKTVIEDACAFRATNAFLNAPSESERIVAAEDYFSESAELAERITDLASTMNSSEATAGQIGQNVADATCQAVG
jgi:hypothetical protein